MTVLLGRARKAPGRTWLLALAAGVALLAALTAAPARALDSAQLSRSLDRSMARSHTPLSGAIVRDLDTGATIYTAHPDAARIPASVEKLFVTSAALRRFGAQGRLSTRLVRSGILTDGRLDGDLVLVGGGDPTLGHPAIARLARAALAAGIRSVSGSVLGDGSHFDELRGGPRTGGRYDPDIGGVLGGLTVDRGFSRAGDPALAAARRLVHALRARGIHVRGRTAAGAAPAGARTIARAQSPSMAELVRMTNVPSDNFYAESLLKGLGASFGAAGSTIAGAEVARSTLIPLGLAPTLVDGSGLSRADRVTPRQIVRLLEQMRAGALAATFDGSLAVAGRTGTLRRRLRGTGAAGVCRGKTGTLDRVSNLAGMCTTREGHTLAFALLMNDVTIWRAHAAQDLALRAIASYASVAPLGHAGS